MSKRRPTILEAGDGRSALRQIAEKPDLVIQDLVLPDMGGFDLLERLRAYPSGAAIPILCCSGYLSRLEQARRHRPAQAREDDAVALERLKHRSYDLIVSGLRMPELDGPGLFESFERAEHPLRSRLVFVTGDTLGEEARTFLNKTRALSVGMPFVPAELKSVIKKAVLRPMVP